jgi:hypothetical protein
MARCLSTDDGYALLALVNGTGAWCGYLGLPDGHRWHGLDYTQVRDVSVHGGLTYSNAEAPWSVIDELALSAEPRIPSWWLGFDCAHSGDHVPALAGIFGRGGRVWTLDDVWVEIENLLAQARSAP